MATSNLTSNVVGIDEKVKASAGDPTPGTLDAKVDGTTIVVSGNQLVRSALTGDVTTVGNAATVVEANVDHNSLANTHNLTTDIDHDLTTNFVADEHVAHSSVTLTAGSGLSGGGDISASRTFNVDINGETDTVITATDQILFADASDSNNIKKDTVQGILDLAGGGGAWTVTDSGTATGNQTITETIGNDTGVYRLIVEGRSASSDQSMDARVNGSTANSYAWNCQVEQNTAGSITDFQENGSGPFQLFPRGFYNGFLNTPWGFYSEMTFWVRDSTTYMRWHSSCRAGSSSMQNEGQGEYNNGTITSIVLAKGSAVISYTWTLMKLN